MKLSLLMILGLTLTLAGCYSYIEPSDYIGGFVTQDGNCTHQGDTSIIFKEQKIEIEFYCFLKKCADMDGETHQGGFFHLKSKSGHYIKGRIIGEEAKGQWYLNMKGENCSGHWAALKN